MVVPHVARDAAGACGYANGAEALRELSLENADPGQAVDEGLGVQERIHERADLGLQLPERPEQLGGGAADRGPLERGTVAPVAITTTGASADAASRTASDDFPLRAPPSRNVYAI